MESILLVEDDDTITLGIKAFLEKKEYKVERAKTLEEAKLLLLNQGEFSQSINKESKIVLVLLDLNLPDGMGYELCRFIRKRSKLPIIFLTVCDEEEQIVKGLDLGADDYVTKPFKLSILFSRIQAVLRRTQSEKKENEQAEKEALGRRLCCGEVSIELDKKYVYLRGNKVELTPGEYKLLYFLLSHKDHTLTRQVLLERLWDEEEQYVNDNTLTVTMKRLREKLDYPSFIKTIRGIGYLVEEDE